MIRLGVISLDHPHATGNHFPALRYIRDAVAVTAIAHTDREPAQPWLDEFNADYYPNRDALLASAQVDAVLITSRNCDHAGDACAAILAGKDVLCDKPISTDIEGAHAIIGAVQRAGVRFITAYPVRFNTSVRQLKLAIENGDLGKIDAIMATNRGCMYEPNVPAWVLDPLQNGGGCIVDHSVHVADIIRWITGCEFATVKAEAATGLRPTAAEDLAVLHGVLTDGALYQIDASWSRRGRDPMWGDVTFRVVGSKGSASLDLYNNQCIEIYNRDGASFNFPNHLIREYAEMFLDYAHAKEQGTRGISADAMDGLRTVELICAAYESVRSGQRVDVARWEISGG